MAPYRCSNRGRPTTTTPATEARQQQQQQQQQPRRYKYGDFPTRVVSQIFRVAGNETEAEKLNPEDEVALHRVDALRDRSKLRR